VLQPVEILKKYWGHESFRPLQEEIIKSVMNRQDTLALLPTGGGKSVCYQVPGLALDGMCIVVSPLVALMHDQVGQLEKKGIRAAAITSAMTFREIETIFNNAIYKTYKFLYISPERIQSKLFLRKLPSLPVNLFAVDESHCISQWGYDFRPSYLQIKKLRELKPEVPVLAVTATATQNTISDIIAQLEFKPGYQVLRTSFARPNLHYRIKKDENKFDTLLATCSKVQGTGIVYVRNRRKTREIADFLQANKITADYYHAGLDAAERAKKQSDWLNNRRRIIVSTNAFGMGIDKPDVRFVVHMDLPDSLEAWFQEAGRGGRDGKTSYAVTLYNDADIQALEEQLEQSFPTLEQVRQVYAAIANFYQVAVGAGEGLSVLFRLDEISARYKLTPGVIFNAVRFLEKENYLAYTDAAFQQARLHVSVSKGELYNFQVQNPGMDHFIKVMLRSYAGIFDGYVNISEFKMARSAKMDLAAVTKTLEKMHKLQLVDYIPQTGLPHLLFTQPRVDAKFLTLSKENYANLKKQARQRMEAVIAFVRDSNTCRSRKVLQYFDEKDIGDCGTCDVCLRKKRQGDPGYTKMREQLILLLGHGDYPFAELVSLMYHYNKDEVVGCLNQMADDKEIIINARHIVSKA
jgi:ATP-dependent DNA helicase RecQ